MNEQVSKKFIRMWVEENYNHYDLLPILLNAGRRSRERFEYGIDEAMAFGGDFHLAFYLSVDQLRRSSDDGYEFYMERDGLGQVTASLAAASLEMNVRIRHLIGSDLSALSDAGLFAEYDAYGAALGRLMGCYVMTQPYWISGLERELTGELRGFGGGDLVSALTSPDVEFIFSEDGDFFRKSFAELLKAEDATIDRTLMDKELYSTRPIDQMGRSATMKKRVLSERAQTLSDILKTISEIRLRMRFLWMPAIYYQELFLMELKRRHDIPKRSLRGYDIGELEELIKTGTMVNADALEERRIGFVKMMTTPTKGT